MQTGLPHRRFPDSTAGEPARQSLDTAKNLLRRHWQLGCLVLGIIAVFWLLYALRTALVPFILGLVFAYLLMPVIRWAEEKLPSQGRWRQTKRVSLIVLIFIIIAGLIAVLSFYVVTAVIEAFVALVNNAPQYIAGGLNTLQRWANVLREQLPPEIQLQMDQLIVEGGVALGNTIRGAFMKGISFVPATFGLMFGFIVLPIFLFYILKDSEKLTGSFYSSLSPWLAEHTRNIVSIIESVLGRYIRAQLLLGLIVAYFTFVGLLFLRIPFYPALAAFAGVTELVPTIGPWIGGAAAVIVTLAVAPDKVIWVIILFFIVQLLENTLLVPRIQGGYLHINPAIVIVLIILGAYIAGFWGLVLAVPLTATGVEIYKYVHRSAQALD
ncbi:AI-2E family transporter [Chloroflexota bacterium]